MSLINDALKRARQAQKPPAPAGAAPIAAGDGPALQPVGGPLTAPPRPTRLWVTPAVALVFAAGLWLLKTGWDKHRQNTPTPVAARSIAAVTPERGTNPIARASRTLESWAARNQVEEISNAAPALAHSEEERPNPPLAAAPAEKTVHAAAPPAPVHPTVTNPLAGAGGSLTSISPAAPALAHPAPASGPSVAAAAPAGLGASATNNSPHSENARVVAMAPPTTPAVPESALKLQGIFYRLKHPTALINGRIVAVTDDIDGYHVVQIERHSVKVMQPGRTNILALR